MIDRRLIAALVVLFGLGVTYVASRPTPTPPAPVATTTTTAAPTTTVAQAGTCDTLKAAAAGTTVTLDGELGDCTIYKPAADVTMTGRTVGRIACYRCDRWRLDDLRHTGSLHMVGGTGWAIHSSTFDGADAGLYGVVAVGQTPETGPPVGWTIRDSLIERPGNNPDHADNQDHALYVIAANGVDLDGVVEDTIVRGSGAGAAVKIGGTGNQGGYGGDAADGVTLRRLTVTNPAPDGTCVLGATNTDHLELVDSTLDCPLAVALAGPFTGTGLTLTGNTIGGRWLFAHIYRPPAPWLGTMFVSYELPSCGQLAACEGNTRR